MQIRLDIIEYCSLMGSEAFQHISKYNRESRIAVKMETVRMPTFSGDQKDFQVWWIRFQAYATVAGFKIAIGRTKSNEMPADESIAIDETTEQGKKQFAAKKANGIAMASLTMALTSEGSIGIITQAFDQDWPGGLACKVVDMLYKRYAPRDLRSKVEMRQALSAVSMKKEEDPARMFEALSGVCSRYHTTTFKIAYDELIAMVLE